MSEQYKPYAASYAILRKGDEVLLARRYNVPYGDGMYSLPAGHLEDGEMPRDALVREMHEELAIAIKTDDLNCKVVQHHRAPTRMSTNFFFECRSWSGEIQNMEQEKCDDLRWFKFDELPGNIVPEVAQILAHIDEEDINYQEFDSTIKL